MTAIDIELLCKQLNIDLEKFLEVSKRLTILDLIQENTELKQQLKAMQEGYVKLVFELRETQERLETLEVMV